MASCEHRWTRLLLLNTHVGVVYGDLSGNVEIEANFFTVANWSTPISGHLQVIKSGPLEAP
ncbi:hypothetical protein RchiOBHm_Chr3g0479001 [Rosa chinensis]|uniref:Uncharacterized protein n=1 Tax=Rosa chinensis TaxID=74649 RepID=A0A2P6RDB3_ROSCH|nr:hypothetical protein RchiOBHm_Chr3g0479001 [Rosa chinensis]